MNNMEQTKTWTVYVHVSPSNKRYVGITSQKNLNGRWRNGKGYKNNPHFVNAINKYGWENFEHKVLANALPEDVAKQMEKDYIKKYNSTNQDFGYNISQGGDGTCGVSHYGETNPFYGKHHTEEMKEYFSEIRKGTMVGELNPFYGKKHSDETKILISNMKKGKSFYRSMFTEEDKERIGKQHSRPIVQFTLDGEYVAEYPSLSYLESLGYRRGSIRDVCTRKRLSYKGYIWNYKNEQDAIGRGYKTNKEGDNIYCLDKDYDVVGVYPSYLSAHNETGINRKIISNACNGDNHLGHGYYWYHKEDYIAMKEGDDYGLKGQG